MTKQNTQPHSSTPAPVDDPMQQYPDFGDPDKVEREELERLEQERLRLLAAKVSPEDVELTVHGMETLIKRGAEIQRENVETARAQWDTIKTLGEDRLIQASALRVLPPSSIPSAIRLLERIHSQPTRPQKARWRLPQFRSAKSGA